MKFHANLSAGNKRHDMQTPIGIFVVLSLAALWCLLTVPLALLVWGFTGKSWFVNGNYTPPAWAAWGSLLAVTLATLALLGVL
jgi:hypothetical protein